MRELAVEENATKSCTDKQLSVQRDFFDLIPFAHVRYIDNRSRTGASYLHLRATSRPDPTRDSRRRVSMTKQSKVAFDEATNPETSPHNKFVHPEDIEAKTWYGLRSTFWYVVSRCLTKLTTDISCL